MDGEPLRSWFRDLESKFDLEGRSLQKLVGVSAESPTP